MYAIIETGGKQYKVGVDQILSVEKLEANVGDKITLNALMACNDDNVIFGTQANNVSVTAEVVEHGKGEKLNIFTYKAKKNVRKRQGHRQPYTKLKVTDIKLS
jgi:large subunit ribosomal protein L21